MLENYRSEAGEYLGWVGGPFMGWEPNSVSWLSFAFSLVAGVLLLLLRALPHSSLWVPMVFFEVASFVFVGGVFDALDGYIARKTGKTSKRGDFLDHILDRYADVAVVGCLSFSTWVNPYIGLLALVSMLLTSYMGTQAQAVTGKRAYGGILGRADRIVLVTFFALLMTGLTAWDILSPAGWHLQLNLNLAGISLGPLDVLLLYFLVAGQVTCIYRALQTWGSLDRA